MTTDQQRHNTIIAALRFYQEQGMAVPENRPAQIQELATDGGNDACMDRETLESFIQELNLGDQVLVEAKELKRLSSLLSEEVIGADVLMEPACDGGSPEDIESEYQQIKNAEAALDTAVTLLNRWAGE